jgi:hypothetical protein
MTIKLEATGQDDFIPEDRRALFAELRPGNTDVVEVQLQYVDPEDGEERVLGQYRLVDLVKVVQEMSKKLLELEERFGTSAHALEIPKRPTTLEV